MNLTEYLNCHTSAMQELSRDEKKIELVVDAITRCIGRGGTIWTAGNGGSASTASHLVCDLAKGAALRTNKPIRAICLNDSMPLNTAWANDFSYDVALQRQLELSARPEDIFIAISGSGSSKNIINALVAAKVLKIQSIALVGFKGGYAKDLADLVVVVNSDDMQVIENLHLLIGHWIFKALA